jgi:hypothetical protein
LHAECRLHLLRQLNELKGCGDDVERAGNELEADEELVAVSEGEVLRAELLEAPSLEVLQRLKLGLEAHEVRLRTLVAPALFQVGDLSLEALLFGRVLLEGFAVAAEVLLDAVELGSLAGDALVGVAIELFPVRPPKSRQQTKSAESGEQRHALLLLRVGKHILAHLDVVGRHRRELGVERAFGRQVGEEGGVAGLERGDDAVELRLYLGENGTVLMRRD